MVSLPGKLRIRFLGDIAAHAALAVLLAVVALSHPAAAQSADSAGLEIYVRDASGALVGNAGVHIVQQQQNIARDGISDKNGYIRFTEIPVGDYVVTVQRKGFDTVVESGITLGVGQTSALTVSLKIAAENTQVNVTAETPIVDTDRSSFGPIDFLCRNL